MMPACGVARTQPRTRCTAMGRKANKPFRTEGLAVPKLAESSGNVLKSSMTPMGFEPMSHP